MHQAILLTGSNLGDRELLLSQALQKIEELAGAVSKVSGVYESEPWGFNAQLSFLNQVIIIETSLHPEELLDTLLRIEEILGRKRIGLAYNSRPIDIDILFYDDLIMRSRKLKIPHPSLHRRMFTLKPLCDIASDFKHPIFNSTIQNLMNKCEDKLWVKKH